MSPAIRLIIAGRNVMFRQCLAAALDRRRRFQVIAEVPDLAVALTRARVLNPDIVVVDLDASITAPELDLVSELSETGCAVLALTVTRAGGVSQILEAGARGYLDKGCELRDLERAIEQIHGGEGVVVATSPAHGFKGRGMGSRHDGLLPHPNLTARELEVLQLVAVGRNNGEIARELCITEHTAKGHLAKILGKLGLDQFHGALPAWPIDLLPQPGGAVQWIESMLTKAARCSSLL